MEIDEKVRKAWFDKFESQMKDEKGTDMLIPYNHLSMVFPTDHTLHDSLDIVCIDTHALEKWATAHGWSIKFSPEKADPQHKNAPPVRFTRIDKN